MTQQIRRMFIAFVALAVAGFAVTWFLPGPKTAEAQTGHLVQQSGQRVDAATVCVSTATSAATLTLTPPTGQYVYLTEIDIQNVVGAAAVTAAASTTVTTTNITGTPAWQIASGTSAGSATQSFSLVFPTGLKSTTAATAVTIVLPTFATNQTVRVNACGYYAP